jgi:hypothetical protein
MRVTAAATEKSVAAADIRNVKVVRETGYSAALGKRRRGKAAPAPALLPAAFVYHKEERLRQA